MVQCACSSFNGIYLYLGFFCQFFKIQLGQTPSQAGVGACVFACGRGLQTAGRKGGAHERHCTSAHLLGLLVLIQGFHADSDVF